MLTASACRARTGGRSGCSDGTGQGTAPPRATPRAGHSTAVPSTLLASLLPPLQHGALLRLAPARVHPAAHAAGPAVQCGGGVGWQSGQRACRGAGLLQLAPAPTAPPVHLPGPPPRRRRRVLGSGPARRRRLLLHLCGAGRLRGPGGAGVRWPGLLLLLPWVLLPLLLLPSFALLPPQARPLLGQASACTAHALTRRAACCPPHPPSLGLAISATVPNDKLAMALAPMFVVLLMLFSGGCRACRGCELCGCQPPPPPLLCRARRAALPSACLSHPPLVQAFTSTPAPCLPPWPGVSTGGRGAACAGRRARGSLPPLPACA